LNAGVDPDSVEGQRVMRVEWDTLTLSPWLHHLIIFAAYLNASCPPAEIALSIIKAVVTTAVACTADDTVAGATVLMSVHFDILIMSAYYVTVLIIHIISKGV
jgi:hypothetical protein